jgi:hypothetical protein
VRAMKIITLLLLISCSTPIIIKAPEHPENGLKTPTLLLPSEADKTLKEAARVFQEYGNSDEFYRYLRKNVDDLEGGNETNIDAAIMKFRKCLNERAEIRIEFVNYSPEYRGRVIGGWRNDHLAQNKFKELDVIERAGHWIHEISHACGFTHVDNDIMIYPIIRRSFPYQVGYKFESFLNTRRK